MLISDWSSDVCSSDLIQGYFRPSLEYNCFQRCLEAAGGGYRSDIKRLVSFGFFLIFRVVLILDIGRASCRERVCQYVKIWVVAVTLQKQNDIIEEIDNYKAINEKFRLNYYNSL